MSLFGEKKHQPGDPFRPSAEWLNGLADAARAFHLGELSRPDPESLPATGHGPILVEVPSSAGNQVELAPMALRAPIFPPDNPERIGTFSTTIGFGVAVAEAADVGPGKIAVLLEPIRAGEIGLAVVSGAVPCRVNVTNAAHGYADLTAGGAVSLTSGASGPARILWQESGTGLKWAVVLLGAGGGSSVLPTIPDPDKSYVLGWDGGGHALVWIETDIQCPPWPP